MGRCPKYLNVDSFDDLARSLNLSLTDDGVSALGEIAELLSIQILDAVDSTEKNAPINFSAVVTAAQILGIDVEVDTMAKTVREAKISAVPTLM